MARGHLIAAQYGRGKEARIKATFTYSDAVPQFTPFNSGSWRYGEQGLIKWGRDKCQTGGNIDVRMFIVVGAIPHCKFWRVKITPKYGVICLSNERPHFQG